ncbi:PfkB family carbohydrate kinase [Latilactobacillus sakei]|uniref:PfkB family carbohydrate kinase n=1 Tax=Latilactobacillus sakei TaxID=1599 RepID=UPI0025B3EE81|nr:PfkB family carbohydrate kinase [Latilactobacillus sakei]MDN4010215.1 PfkB family carbohydrate kinase [Latilactobacillus sakei]
MEDKYVVVVGGLNMDIAGMPGKDFIERDSNPGEVNLSVGGVGQNIAHNLANLGVPTYLMTVYGDDQYGAILHRECETNKINLDYAAEIKGANSSTYLYVTDGSGDMLAAINDMSIVNNITPDFLKERLAVINQATLCIVDANIPQESIEWLADHLKVPMYVDPVSVAKARRFENALNKIDTFKPNEMEAELLTGIKISDESSAKMAAEYLVNQGIRHVFISLGAHGILCADESQTVLVPIIKVPIISCNGAGDCSMATIAWAYYHFGKKASLKEIGQYAQAASSITVGSASAVSSHLTAQNVIDRCRQAVKN